MSRAMCAMVMGLAAALTCAAAPQTEPASTNHDQVLLILPLAVNQPGREWIGRSIQQDLVADLTQATRLRVVASSQGPGADAQQALASGRDAGAQFVLWGQAQIAGSEVRVTGQLLYTADGRTMGALKATAPVDDLFPLEDSLAMQAVQALPLTLIRRPPQTQPAQPLAAAPQPLPEAPPAPQPTAEAPSYYSYQEPPSYSYPPAVYYNYNYYYPSPYAYGYPYYWYGWYPWWGPDVLVFGDFDDFHHHHFDHDYFYSHPGGFAHPRGAPRGPVGHEFGHYGIGGPNALGHRFGGPRPGFGDGAARGGGGAARGGGGGGGAHER